MFDTDKKFSVATAEKFIYPVLKKLFGTAAKIFSVEKEKTPLAQELDKAGIDIAVASDGIMTGINSRCYQWRGFKPTFTIRKTRNGLPAEYDRILDGLACGGITPKYFAQCYSNGNSAKVGIIETNQLFHYAEYNSPPVRSNGDVSFFSIQWDDLPETEIWQIEHGILKRTTEITIAV